MSARVWLSAAIIAASFGLSTVSRGAGPAVPSLCVAGEQPVLTCGVGKGRIASLCATGTLTAAGAATVKMQYRFGRKGAVEMAWPARPADPRGLFVLSATGYSGGGTERIRFSNGGYDYFVFQRTLAGDRDSEGHREHLMDEGVAVLRGSKVVAVHTCRTPTDNGGYPKMYDVLQREEREDLDIPL